MIFCEMSNTYIKYRNMLFEHIFRYAFLLYLFITYKYLPFVMCRDKIK